MGERIMDKKTIKLALDYFAENDTIAYEDDGNIFVSRLNIDTHVQVSNAEIHYRAELQGETT